MKSEWVDILSQVQSGAISAEEGAARMQQAEENASAARAQGASTPPPAQGADTARAAETSAPLPDERMGRWKQWWLYPFWAGLGIFMLAAALMAWSYTNERFGWFACAWLPLLFGLTVLALSAWSRTARWLHVRINDPGKTGEKATRIAISMPVPVHLVGWGLRMFGPMFPKFKDKNLDAIAPLFESLGDTQEPLTVEVNDKGGEKVQIYIV